MRRWQGTPHHNADPDWLTQTAADTFHSHDQGTIARVASNPATLGPTLADIAEAHAHRDYAIARQSRRAPPRHSWPSAPHP
jgi:hypothetical protein